MVDLEVPMKIPMSNEVKEAEGKALLHRIGAKLAADPRLQDYPALLVLVVAEATIDALMDELDLDE
jgi:hypothetical protein